MKRAPMIVAVASGVAGAQSFTGLRFLPGGQQYSQAWHVSQGGSVVVGTAAAQDGTFRAFRWTRQGGMVSLGTLGTSSEGRGVSADGSVVVGFTSSPVGVRAFRWTIGSGMVSLGVLPGGAAINGAGPLMIPSASRPRP